MKISLSLFSDESVKIELDIDDIESMERVFASNDTSMHWAQDGAGAYTVITLREGRTTSQGVGIAFVAEDPSEIVWEEGGLLRPLAHSF